jgi:broad specificity phosphatase PhoE
MTGGSIWLLRHAESVWNATGRWQGHADVPLSERGVRQAAVAAPRVAAALAGERLQHLYCSDLQRAVDTARAVGHVLGLEPVLVPGLRELDVGSWMGLSTEQIEQRDPERLHAFQAGEPDVRPGGGETRREIRKRVRGVVSGLVAADPSASVLCVVHLGVVRALIPGAEPAHTALERTSLDEIARLTD